MSPVPIPILTPDQASAWDRAAQSKGIAAATLMESAGRAVAGLLPDRFGERIRHGVLIAAGPGNNGGDGWVVARTLHRHGIPVWVTGPALQTSAGLCAAAAALAREDGVRGVAPDGPWPAVGLVVDALLGTGAKGPPRGEVLALAERLADLALPIVAVDGPTGLDLLTGVQHGSLHAALTVTFGGYRRGHLLARDEVGDLVVADIGFPPPDPSWSTLYTDQQAAAALPRLPAATHKGVRGRILVVGGDLGLTGAARLAARAAFGAGAGLVHIAAPAPSIEALATAEPDIQGRNQPLDGPIQQETLELLARADAVVIGPGLNRSPGRQAFVVDVLGRSRAAIVDADALTALQGALPALRDAAAQRPVVLTPHLGEFRTLFPGLSAGVEVDPWAAATAAAAATGATVVLKGVPTVVAAPDGRTVTVAAGNPGLATGGSGDTLSGLIGTFLAQGLDPVEASALGAQVLGRAADLAARRASARGLRPMDVVAALPELWRGWALSGSLTTLRTPILHELERPASL
jgi:NAD(P)H-hydrate epimerase